MSFYNIVTILLFIFVVTFCIYSIVDRICNYIEKRKKAKSLTEFVKQNHEEGEK